MATLPTARLVSVDEYLNTSYEQDVEFVDGVLVEKGMPTIFHQLLSKLLLEWFRNHEEALRTVAVADVRTQIVERARYRLPDVMVFTRPVRLGKVFTAVPDVVIEIKSPDDRDSDVLFRFKDYSRIGVRHLIDMDPERFVARRFQNGDLVETEFKSLPLSGGREDLPFDSAAIFEGLRQKIADCESE